MVVKVYEILILRTVWVIAGSEEAVEENEKLIPVTWGASDRDETWEQDCYICRCFITESSSWYVWYFWEHLDVLLDVPKLSPRLSFGKIFQVKWNFAEHGYEISPGVRRIWSKTSVEKNTILRPASVLGEFAGRPTCM